MLIRRVEKKDIPAIARLFFDTVHTVNGRDYTPRQIQAWAPKVQATSYWARRFRHRHTWVAQDRGVIVGFAQLETTGHIDCFYVHAQWQGRGVGASLLQRIVAESRRRGIARLYAEVSLTARRFFRKQGFLPLRRQTKGHRGRYFTQFPMHKRLP
ncbi:MAG: GNAT family N-acetyltransferase [Gammaproteobacteria bacterium]|nr:GNAT family N-acetyltransferase [Gammaproteobacteria bacterium]MCP5423499.1 GNAT family N-acetyltransferase [Gammaproteobacteria bacterium]